MNQVENSDNTTDLNDEQAIQLEGFINLLAELNIIQLSETNTSTSEEILTIKYEILPKVTSSIELTKSCVDSSTQSSTDFDSVISQAPMIPEMPPEVSIEEDVENNTLAAFEQLQNILVGPELRDLQKITDKLNQSLSKLANQIYDPVALIDLLVPLIHEILKHKINESKEDIIQVITPIIDEVIQNRTEQDKVSMGTALAPILPEAISQQIHNAPEEVTEALAPTMGRAIKKQIEIEQDTVVDALYPIIGSTISKYMAETIRAINQQIEETLSIKGIQRKIRAKLQGVSEAELIFREAIKFTVQAVFLIHKTSGLVISDIQPDAHKLESEMVAGMLTAIRSFANDCIIQPGASSELDAIEYGTSKIILEVAGYCYLAIVVQGEPSKQFISNMRQILIRIVREYGDKIEKFDGDPTMIPNQIHLNLAHLTNHDNNHVNTKHPSKPSPLMILSVGILSAILIPFGIWKYHAGVIRDVKNRIEEALVSAPELAVYRLNVKEDHGKLQLTGKVPNQPLSQKALQIAQAAAPSWSIDNQIVAVEVPADPVIAAAEVQRVTEVFNSYKGTAISTQYTDGKVLIKGSVRNSLDATMINHAFEKIPGVKFVSSAIEIPPAKIGIRFYFNTNSGTLIKADLNSKVKQVKSFLNQYPNKRLKITGYSNSPSEAWEFQQLALKRAQAVKLALVNLGISSARLDIAGKTTLPPGVDTTQPEWQKRCVVLEPD